MSSVHLFGYTSLTGRYIREIANAQKLKIKYYCNSKDIKDCTFIDLKDYKSFNINSQKRNQILLSLTPIWHFSDFFENLSNHKPHYLHYISRLIVTSSSSVETKKYSFSEFDKYLYIRLKKAEEKLIKICSEFGINLYILRPTLIYGQLGEYKDKNLSKIVTLMRSLPFLLIPNQSGLRQPIHAKQLAELCLFLANNENEKAKQKFLAFTFGGDTSISYFEMILLIRNSLGNGDKGKNCKLLKVPKRLFILLINPISIFSPKIFESLLRIFSNLSGFKSVSQIMNRKTNQQFPHIPYS